MKQRLESLDALRGFAILTMVLSGSIAFGGVLPGWMYHAQVPPPTHAFDPTCPGITWVDLVFPFFLFSMGAAFPLVLHQPLSSPTFFNLLRTAFRRFGLLLFFALFSQHFKSWVLSNSPGWIHQVQSIFAFLILFIVLYSWKEIASVRLRNGIRLVALLAAIGWMCLGTYSDGKSFDPYRSDIILVVLANMAFFGTIIYGLTQNRPWVRVAILPIVMAIFFASKQEGWAKQLFYFDSIGPIEIDWAYKFYFLKYLFIVIPGIFAGEWLIRLREESSELENSFRWMGWLGLSLIGWNLYGLYTRQLDLNLAGSIVLLLFMYSIVRRSSTSTLHTLFMAGAYLLLLGLSFEAFEGGIKKDPSNYSYYFVCSGLAFMALIVLESWKYDRLLRFPLRYLSLQGQNPMVAYVAGSLLLLPLMTLTGLKPYWDGMHQDAWMGFAKGALFTGTVSLVTYFFVKRRWFWRT